MSLVQRLGLAAAALLVLSYQNCSPTDFKSVSDSVGKPGTEHTNDDINDNDEDVTDSTVQTIDICAQNRPEQSVQLSAVPQDYSEIKGGKIDINTSTILGIRGASAGQMAVRAESIGPVSEIRAGHCSLQARSIASIANLRSGYDCVKADTIGNVDGLKSGHAFIDGPENGKGTIDSVKNTKAGLLIIRNMKINSISDTAGRIVLINCDVGEIKNHKGQLVTLP